MTAIGFSLFVIARFLQGFFEIKRSDTLGVFASTLLAIESLGMALMLIGVAVFLWRMMP